ncbi:DUF1643 domain-containing protein [Clostridium senegalense]
MDIELVEKTIDTKMHYIKSESGNEYRYSLYKDWRNNKSNCNDKKLVCIMLNPSKAKCVEGDNTITNIINYFSKENFERLVVYNLFALMCTEPKELKNRESSYEELNIKFIKEELKMLNNEDIIFIGWGRIEKKSRYVKNQANSILDLLYPYESKLRCFRDKNGIMPRHPVVIGKEWTLEMYKINKY